MVVFISIDFPKIVSGREETMDQLTAEEMRKVADALVLCRSFYRENARYGAKIGFFSSYKLFKTKDSWVFKLDGKLQNMFGAWQKVIGHCEVPFELKFKDPFDSRNIETFEYIP